LKKEKKRNKIKAGKKKGKKKVSIICVVTCNQKIKRSKTESVKERQKAMVEQK
tara:strand:- start:410 stop:568 length:159 start_codon:yes stop_codon:yes gene_type:complete